MIEVALQTADPVLRRRLDAALRARPGLRLVATEDADTVVTDAPAATARPDRAVVVLVDAADEDAALDALDAGAAAIVPRSLDASDIATAIEAAARGFAVMPRALLARLLGAEGDPAAATLAAEGDHPPSLTPRERDVLAALADGASNKAIARRLGISFHTVKFHVAAILAKLGAETRTEAVAQAARLGLVML